MAEYEAELEEAMETGDEEALRAVVGKINAAVHEAAAGDGGATSTGAAIELTAEPEPEPEPDGEQAETPPPPVSPPTSAAGRGGTASGVALSTPSLEGLESPPGVAMAIPAFPPSPMPRPNLTTEQARAEATAADAARGLHGNLPGGVADAGPAPPVGRAGTPRAGSRHTDESMLLAGSLPSAPAAGAGTPAPSQPLSSPPPVTSAASGDDGGGTSSGDEGSSVGGWRARAALKAARLRQQADAAVKAATESLETLEVGAKVASAANAAAETAKQAQEKAAKAFTEMTVSNEPGVNALMATRDGEVVLSELIEEPDFLSECRRGNRRLLKFLCDPQVLMELCGYIVNSANEQDGLVRRYQLPFIATDALANTPALAQFILSAEGRPCLEALFTFVDNGGNGSGNGSGDSTTAAGARLDPLLAGYFCKVVLGLFSATATPSLMLGMSMGALGGDATQQEGQLAGSMAGFLMERPALLHAILRHVGNYSIKELVVAMLGAPSSGRTAGDGLGGGQMGGGFGTFMDRRDVLKPMLPVTFIEEQRVFYTLATTLSDPSADEESHVQTAAVLTTVATTPTLRSKLTIPMMLHTDVTSTLTNAVASAAHSKAARGAVASCARRAMEVLTVLINVSTEVGRPPEQAGIELIRTVVEMMPALTATLTTPGPPAALPSGTIPSRVGGLRMAAVLLVEALMRSEQGPLVFTAMLEHGVLELLLSIMLSYPTANMLHNSVCATMLAALSSGDAALRQCLIGPQCALLQRLLTQYELHDLERDGFQADSSVVGVFRPAYMGHLYRIAEAIGEMCGEDQLMEYLRVGDAAAAARKVKVTKSQTNDTSELQNSNPAPVTPREAGNIDLPDGPSDAIGVVEGQQENAPEVDDRNLVDPPAVTKEQSYESLESATDAAAGVAAEAAAAAEPLAVVEQEQGQQPSIGTAVTRESLADVERTKFDCWMAASSQEVMAGWQRLRSGGFRTGRLQAAVVERLKRKTA